MINVQFRSFLIFFLLMTGFSSAFAMMKEEEEKEYKEHTIPSKEWWQHHRINGFDEGRWNNLLDTHDCETLTRLTLTGKEAELKALKFIKNSANLFVTEEFTKLLSDETERLKKQYQTQQEIKKKEQKEHLEKMNHQVAVEIKAYALRVGEIASKRATSQCCLGGDAPEVKNVFSRFGFSLYEDCIEYHSLFPWNENDFAQFSRTEGRVAHYIKGSLVQNPVKDYMDQYLIGVIRSTAKLLYDRQIEGITKEGFDPKLLLSHISKRKK